MIVLRPRNAHQALWQALRSVLPQCHRRESRNGDVLVAAEPVTTRYDRPWERVVWWPERDANPFFHLMESLWMLAGRNDVDTPAFYVARMREYSDDGVVLRGAYGHRWRVFFGLDQIDRIIEALREDPTCRRQVIQIWSAQQDLGWQSSVDLKDIPCNLTVHFQINHHGSLDMTVFCRSNDAVWGAYGANAVHFSFLQEYVALALKVTMGRYWQVSDNFHFYDNDQLEKLRPITQWFHGSETDHYANGARAARLWLYDDRERFDHEVQAVLNGGSDVEGHFLRSVAVPLRDAYSEYKGADSKAMALKRARAVINGRMATCDWRIAALEWLQRREERWKASAQSSELATDGKDGGHE